MSSDKKFCYNCMRELGESNICPNCGYFQNTEQPEYCLKPGTVLLDRYLLGNMISENSEGITYIAYDNVIGSRVEIREYIPLELCSRGVGENGVNVIQGKETIFKAFMSDFAELAKDISKFRTLPNIKQIYDVFEANNTVYYVSEYIEGNLTLSKLLKTSSETILDWDVLSGLMLPLVNTVGILNASNIIHRGISTDTIFVTPKGDFKLGCFCISAVRAYKSELSGEIIDGYAAPEQYSVNSWYGPWTDVYALCAVIYRVLTGVVPASARERSGAETLLSPRNINPAIPPRVSDAIVKGMKLSPEGRLQSMMALSAMLSAPKADEIDIKDEKKKKKKNSGGKMPVLITIGITVAVLVVIGALLIKFASSGDDTVNTGSINTLSLPYVSSYSSSESSSDGASSAPEAKYAMPQLVGMQYSKVIINDDYTDLVSLEYKEDFSEKYEKGTIIKQSVQADTPISLNTKVTVTVSVGPKFITVPDFSGKTLTEYMSDLDSRGISYNVRLKNVTGEISGTIVKVTPDAGTKLDRSKDASVTIYLDNTGFVDSEPIADGGDFDDTDF